MPADPLGRGVNDDIGSVLDWAAEIGGRERVVNDQRHPRLVSDVGDIADADDVELWVTDGLDVERLGAIGNGVAEVVEIRRIDEGRLDPVARQRDREQVVRAPVEA